MKWMIVAAALALGACVNDAGAQQMQGTERSYALTGFDSIELGGPDTVRVSVGPGFSVRATGPEETLDRLEITVKDDSLRVRRKRQAGGSFSREPGATVEVTMPAIRAAALGGSGTLNIDRVERGDFAAAVGGSGDLTLERVAVERMKAAIAGSGTLSLTGTARQLDASIAGSGDIAGGELVVERASVSVMGSGDVRAAVRGNAAVSVMGSGDVDLGPDARCTISKAGSGQVRCGG